MTMPGLGFGTRHWALGNFYSAETLAGSAQVLPMHFLVRYACAFVII